MQNIQDIYQRDILPLPDAEKLKLANLILEKTGKGSNGSDSCSRNSFRDFFGKGQAGGANGSDNETIDADLARSYLDPHNDK